MSSYHRLVYLSHQLGGYDGVSVEAAKWIDAISSIGFEVTPAAGLLHPSSLPGISLPSLWRPLGPGDQFLAPPPLTQAEVNAVIDAAGGSGGFVVLDNIATMPTAADNIVRLVAALEAANMRMVVRHHDPSWDGFGRIADPRFPLAPAHAAHVAISAYLRDHLWRRRGIHAAVMLNPIDLKDILGGNRARIRKAMAIDDDDLVLLHPVTPYPRKNVSAAARFADAVAVARGGRVVYWLTGGSTDPLPGGGRYRFITGRCGSRANLYAAADAVLLTSYWEGWGNPVAEAAAVALPVVTGEWPALDELRHIGLRDIPVAAPDAVSRLLAEVGRQTSHRVESLRGALAISQLVPQLETLLRQLNQV